MKKSVSLFCVVTMFILVMLGTVPAYALTQTEDIEETQILESDTYYSFDAETKTLTISGDGATPNFSNSSGSTNSQPWYSWRSDGSIEHIVVEEGITSLGTYFFYSVTTADISLPSTLLSIGNYAMARTNSNSTVVLPEGLETISNYAFYNTSGLVSVSIPSTVTSIGMSAFESCTSLESVEFVNLKMTVSIGKKAFLKCSSLTTVTVPKYATLSDYSFGYSAASAGSVYSDFVMRVYRDSDAYTFASSKAIAYEIIDTYDITEGESIDCTYYSDNIDSVLTFIFVPEVTAIYSLTSTGDTDLLCELEDTTGNVLSSNDDISAFNLNFCVSAELTAGETYYFCVTTNSAEGDFTVTLMPETVESIACSVDSLTLLAADCNSGKFDVESLLEGSTVTVTYDTGYTDEVEYTSGVTYRDTEIEYSDTQSESAWSCSDYYCTLSLGDVSTDIPVAIEHSYESSVVEATYTTKGYTVYTCTLCGDTYYSDYVNSIGIKVTGNVVLMESPDGSHPNNYPIAYAEIYVDGENVYTAKSDGSFSFYVDSDVTEITIEETYGLTRTVTLNTDSENQAQLGNIAMFHFDYNSDGYVNIKDYAKIKRIYGTYPIIRTDEYLSRDYNQDGTLDSADWFDVGAENFYTYGKIDESIYDICD